MTVYRDPEESANATWRRKPVTPPVDDLFSRAAEAEAAKAEAMARAEEHASQRWCALAYDAVLLVSGLLPTFTSDDVAAALEQSGRDVIESERNLKALGSVMLRAARAGLIVKTGRVRNSTRKSLHASPRTEWRMSTTYEYRNRQLAEE